MEQLDMFISEEEADRKAANAFSWGVSVGFIVGALVMFVVGVLIGAYL